MDEEVVGPDNDDAALDDAATSRSLLWTTTSLVSTTRSLDWTTALDDEVVGLAAVDDEVVGIDDDDAALDEATTRSLL